MLLRTFLFSVIFTFIAVFAPTAYAEHIFLKDGSIFEAKIVSETDKQMKINKSGAITTLDRSKILRVRFDADYQKQIYIKKTDGKTVEGFIVEEDSEYYTIRERLDSPAEFKVERKEVVAISQEKYVSKGTYYALGIIPGGSQFYVKKDIKGAIFLGSSVAAYGFTGYSFYSYKKKRDDYRSVPRGQPQSAYDSKYNAYKSASNMLTASLITCGVIYLAHWADVLFFSAPDFSTKQDAPKKAYLDLHIGEPLPQQFNTSNMFLSKEMPLSVGIGMTF